LEDIHQKIDWKFKDVLRKRQVYPFLRGVRRFRPYRRSPPQIAVSNIFPKYTIK